jgi:hypothetical protein
MELASESNGGTKREAVAVKTQHSNDRAPPPPPKKSCETDFKSN